MTQSRALSRSGRHGAAVTCIGVIGAVGLTMGALLLLMAGINPAFRGHVAPAFAGFLGYAPREVVATAIDTMAISGVLFLAAVLDKMFGFGWVSAPVIGVGFGVVAMLRIQAMYSVNEMLHITCVAYGFSVIAFCVTPVMSAAYTVACIILRRRNGGMPSNHTPRHAATWRTRRARRRAAHTASPATAAM
jgi:hypothetical protein